MRNPVSGALAHRELPLARAPHRTERGLHHLVRVEDLSRGARARNGRSSSSVGRQGLAAAPSGLGSTYPRQCSPVCVNEGGSWASKRRTWSELTGRGAACTQTADETEIGNAEWRVRQCVCVYVCVPERKARLRVTPWQECMVDEGMAMVVDTFWGMVLLAEATTTDDSTATVTA